MQYELSDNDGFGYLGNQRVKKDGVQQNFTQDQVEEYAKCMIDPVYFAKKYAKVIHIDKGLIPFDLYPYQERMFQHFKSNRFSIVLACRQSGKSISVAIYILWYAIFHPDKTVAILANKGATAREMLARVTLALENLPFFLQPGCKILNKGSLRFSNESRIIASATSGSSIRGMSINLLYLDAFAFVENSDTFYTSTYPVISSGKNSQVIITSTMNGVGNFFYKLWEGATQGANEYKPFRVDWFDVPGRDAIWKAQTIANTSQLQFDQEFGNTALGGVSNLLISSAGLLGLQCRVPLRYKTAGHTNDIRIYAEPEPANKYFVLVDVSKGRGQDYSTATVIDISSPLNIFYQVCTYRNNLVSPLILPDIIVSIAKMYNNALLIIENNDSGQVVCNGVYHDLEYENVFLESAIKSGGVGVTMTKKIKRIGCSNLKDLIESGKLVVYDTDTISELSTFEVTESGGHEASGSNHDDLVMNLVLFAWFVNTPGAEMDGDTGLREILYRDKIRALEEDVPFIGLFPEIKPLAAGNDRVAELVRQEMEWNFW